MAESDFVVTLPSNSNMGTNPSNEPNNYTVKLAEPLNLEGEWEAALVSVQYTPSWYAFNHAIRFHLFWVCAKTNAEVQTDGYTVDASSVTGDTSYSTWTATGAALRTEASKHGASFAELYKTNKIKADMRYALITMYPRYYDSILAVGDAFCQLIKDYTEKDGVSLHYEYDTVTKTGRLKIRGGYMYILMENYIKIAELLGLSFSWLKCDKCPDYLDRRDRTSHYFEIQTGPTLTRGRGKLQRVNSFWIYSNITQYQLVGDYKAPLLGIIPATSNTENRVHYTVNPIHFLAVNRNHIPEITIKIVDDKGDPIPFAKNSEDNLVCCLRFRRRKNAVAYIK